MDLANWALQTSLKFTTGVKYKFHKDFLAGNKTFEVKKSRIRGLKTIFPYPINDKLL